MTGYVYFVQAESGGPIKVGVAADIEIRLRQLQTGHPERLVVRNTLAFPSTIEAFGHEVELHQRFAHWRMAGEWFYPGRELCALAGVEQQLSRTQTEWLKRARAENRRLREEVRDLRAALHAARLEVGSACSRREDDLRRELEQTKAEVARMAAANLRRSLAA